jgi:AAA15 family ATPase/GTPase
MIHYIKIVNFGPIRDEVELNFEAVDQEGSPAYEVEMPDKRRLLKLAYIYGPNASGKTTVLTAVDFLRKLWLEPATNKEEELRYSPFLFRPQPQQFPSSIELAFYAGGSRYVYWVSFSSISILTEKLVVYRTHQPTELFNRTTDMEKRLSHVEFGSRIKGVSADLNALSAATLHNNSVLGAFQKTNVDLVDFEELSRWSQSFFGNMINAETDLSDETADDISSNPAFNQWMNIYLNRADKNIRGVSVKVEKLKDLEKLVERWMRELPNERERQRLERRMVSRQVNFIHALEGNEIYALPLKQESSGSVRYFGLGSIWYRLLTTSSYSGIDELDTSLHADLIKYLLELFLLNSKESQLLFTTHSLSMLADSDFIRRDALWFTEKGPNGEVSLYSAAEFDSETLRKGASIINAYKAGRLGGKPNLGSPYINAD